MAMALALDTGLERKQIGIAREIGLEIVMWTARVAVLATLMATAWRATSASSCDVLNLGRKEKRDRKDAFSRDPADREEPQERPCECAHWSGREGVERTVVHSEKTG